MADFLHLKCKKRKEMVVQSIKKMTAWDAGIVDKERAQK